MTILRNQLIQVTFNEFNFNYNIGVTIFALHYVFGWSPEVHPTGFNELIGNYFRD